MGGPRLPVFTGVSVCVCAKYKVDLIDKSARIGYLKKIINIKCILYIPTKFHDDRNLSYTCM